MENKEDCTVCKSDIKLAKRRFQKIGINSYPICEECFTVVLDFIEALSFKKEPMDYQPGWPPETIVSSAGNYAAERRGRHLAEKLDTHRSAYATRIEIDQLKNLYSKNIKFFLDYLHTLDSDLGKMFGKEWHERKQRRS